MKTQTPHILMFLLSVVFSSSLVMTGGTVHARMPLSVARTSDSDQQYENSRRERNLDFEKYLKSRERSPAAELKAAEELRAQREAAEAKRKAALAAYAKTMKRYSMEEVEARDRADEQRLEKLKLAREKERETFVGLRNRRREIDTRVGQIDAYREFNIDMKNDPESKVSGSSSASGTGSGAGDE